MTIPKEDNFILINSIGEFAERPIHSGGGFGSNELNDVDVTLDLNKAYIFKPVERVTKYYKEAMCSGFYELPAWEHRIVTIGVKLS